MRPAEIATTAQHTQRQSPSPRNPTQKTGDSQLTGDLRRRQFLEGLGAAGGVLCLTDLDFLGHLPRVSAAETHLPTAAVKFQPDIEPLVRLLEETPRDQVIARFAEKIVAGTSYRDVLAALLLAGVRNVQPRPSVGFKFHAVLVVNSAHLASLAAPDSDRWLPIFWALDYFKSSQERDVEEGDWTMASVDESRLPSPERARRAFREAMETWDVEAADVATAALCRTAGAGEVFDLMAHYGCRDFRSIGHKAIYVANAYRTLQCIGWRYAEPVLRSLSYAILNHTGEPNPAQNELTADAAWRLTQKTLADGTGRWEGGRLDQAATTDHLATLRTATPEEAVAVTAKMLDSGISPQSVIDALFLSAGEMVIQQPAIVALHAATTTNAMQYAYRTVHRRSTRQELLLQNAAFIPYFRRAMEARGKVGTQSIDRLPESDDSSETPTLEQIFDTVSQDRSAAERQMFRFLEQGGRPDDLINAARRLVFLKGNDSHDYKFSSAVLEDYFALSPEFRNRFLSSSAHLLPGSGGRDNGLKDRVQQALG